MDSVRWILLVWSVHRDCAGVVQELIPADDDLGIDRDHSDLESAKDEACRVLAHLVGDKRAWTVSVLRDDGKGPLFPKHHLSVTDCDPGETDH